VALDRATPDDDAADVVVTGLAIPELGEEVNVVVAFAAPDRPKAKASMAPVKLFIFCTTIIASKDPISAKERKCVPRR